jgi:glutamyl-tRNA synthetase
VINTPQQILIYQALALPLPQFAHTPMILAPTGEKLSKRHAAVSVLEYKDLGFLPDAVLNYLARLGWSHGDQEIFTRSELIEKFAWGHVGETGARFDIKKFQYVQGNHLRMLEAPRLAELVAPFLERRGLSVAADSPQLLAAVPLIAPRAITLVDAAEALDYFFREPPNIDPKAQAKFLAGDKLALLGQLTDLLTGLDAWTAAPLEAAVKAWLDARSIELKDVAQPARVALTGRTASPGLFEVMEVLGKERCLVRLRAASMQGLHPAR